MKLRILLIALLLVAAISLNSLIICVRVHSENEMQGTVNAHLRGQPWPASQSGTFPGTFWFFVEDSMQDVPVDAVAVSGMSIQFETGSITYPISYIDFEF